MEGRISRRVVVITGASSGIGCAAALAFADGGDAVVLGARREDALRDVAAECERRGGAALAVPTDVTDEAAVEALARRAAEAFGRVDVWVNDAAVTAFGRFEETPPDVFRRVIETNLFGCVHGARAALRQFREQGSGVLINVASVVVWTPQPYTSAYVASKHAIRAFSESLRQELGLDGAPGIRVCTVLPATIDTPLFQQGANYAGRAARPMPPVYPPERVAAAIVRVSSKPKPETIVGGVGHLAWIQRGLLPLALSERLLARKVDRDHFEDRPAPYGPGNLFEPMPRYARTSGGWRRDRPNATPKAALMGAALLLPALLLWAGRRAGGGRPGLTGRG